MYYYLIIQAKTKGNPLTAELTNFELIKVYALKNIKNIEKY